MIRRFYSRAQIIALFYSPIHQYQHPKIVAPRLFSLRKLTQIWVWSRRKTQSWKTKKGRTRVCPNLRLKSQMIRVHISVHAPTKQRKSRGNSVVWSKIWKFEKSNICCVRETLANSVGGQNSAWGQFATLNIRKNIGKVAWHYPYGSRSLAQEYDLVDQITCSKGPFQIPYFKICSWLVSIYTQN